MDKHSICGSLNPLDYLIELMQKTEVAAPIYTSELAGKLAAKADMPLDEARRTVDVCLREILKQGKIADLRQYEDGIFYRTVLTPFGEREIDMRKVIYEQYMKDGNGYETGSYILNALGLTTWLAKDRLIVTNNTTTTKVYSELRLIVKPGRTHITEQNKFYLQTLDVLEMLKDHPIDCDDRYKILSEHVKSREHDFKILVGYASLYYDNDVLTELGKLAAYDIN